MSDQGQGGNTNMDLFKGFFRNSAAAFAGGGACYLNYRSMRTIFQHRMVSGGPAVTFVMLFGLLNYQGYKYARNQIKSNGKETYEDWKNTNKY